MHFRPLTWILAGIMLLLDIYVFQAVKAILHHASPRLRVVIYGIYWLLTLLSLFLLFFSSYLQLSRWPPAVRMVVLALVTGMYLAKLLTVVFLLIDDLRRGVQWVAEKLGRRFEGRAAAGDVTGITRSQFLTRLGLLAGGSLFATLVYGFSNKYDYRVKRHQLHFPGLPPAFKGLKILQISDIHSGSFDNKVKVSRGWS